MSTPEQDPGRSEPIIVTAMEEIVKLIEFAAENSHPVVVRIRGSSTPYYTMFDFKYNADLEGMRKGESIYVVPLDPPLGNMRIRFSPDVTVQFFTDMFLVDMSVTFSSVMDDKSLQLTFPSKVTCRKQMRRYPRIKVEPEWDILLNVFRPSGVEFEAKIYDISWGGMAFFPTIGIAQMLERAKVRILVHHPQLSSMEFQAVILGRKKIEDFYCYRSYFLINSSAAQKNLSTLLVYLKRHQTQKRKNLFGK